MKKPKTKKQNRPLLAPDVSFRLREVAKKLRWSQGDAVRALLDFWHAHGGRVAALHEAASGPQVKIAEGFDDDE